MLKFVLDVGVGNAVLNLLRERGYDVVAITELDNTMPDSAILDLAEADHRMVVTMDKDFGELVFQSRRKHSGVLLLRLEDASGQEKADILEFILEHYTDLLEENFCVFQNGRLRIRGA